MAKLVVIKYKCDSCGTIVQTKENNEMYQGWFSIDNVNAVIPTDNGHKRIEIEEKHFCSIKCFNNILGVNDNNPIDNFGEQSFIDEATKKRIEEKIDESNKNSKQPTVDNFTLEKPKKKKGFLGFGKEK